MAQEQAATITAVAGEDTLSRALNDFYSSLDPKYNDPYVKLHINLVQPESAPNITFYVKRGKRFRIYREAENSLSPFEIQALLDSGINVIYLERKDANKIREYLESAFQESLQKKGADVIPIEPRVGLMRSAAVRITEELFQNPNPESIRKGMKVVSGFVDLLKHDARSFYFLIKLSSHDHYTYQHSVGVATHAIALAKKIGMSGEKDLADIGIAGLLHDIGKTKVNPQIINKPGPLNEQEWEEMKSHSHWGYELVKDNPEISLRSKLAILHHHEDNVGTGYPSGLTENQISIFAKIVTITDIFSALTSDKNYSKSKTSYEALKFMQETMLKKIDKELFMNLVMIYGGKLE